LVLLICAGLGWHNKDDITKEREDELNELLEKIWRILRQKILTSDRDGYKLDFLQSTQFEIAGEEYLCPVTNRMVDKVFKGYSPLIKGNLESRNIEYYKIESSKNHQFPVYSFPYHQGDNNEPILIEKVEAWLKENSIEARNKGLWNDLHERIFDYEKLYEISYLATINLDKVIDINYYPVPQSKYSNLKNRPIGLGIQGLADVLVLLRIKFDSEESLEFNKKIMEIIYLASITASNDLAKNRYENVKKLIDYINK
jgi:hypothetical protein